MMHRSCVVETPVHRATPYVWPSSRSPTIPRLPQLQAACEATSHSSLHPLYLTHTGSTDGSSSSSPSPPTAPRQEPKKNASRERMKSELLALRVQASCLETELAYLQQLAQERITVGTGVGDDSEPIRNSREPSGGWKAMAERQRARRIRAEMQNRRLRTTVESQMHEWKTLQTLFDDRSQSLLDKIGSVHGVGDIWLHTKNGKKDGDVKTSSSTYWMRFRGRDTVPPEGIQYFMLAWWSFTKQQAGLDADSVKKTAAIIHPFSAIVEFQVA